MWVITAMAPQLYHTPTALRYNNGFPTGGKVEKERDKAQISGNKRKK